MAVKKTEWLQIKITKSSKIELIKRIKRHGFKNMTVGVAKAISELYDIDIMKDYNTILKEDN